MTVSVVIPALMEAADIAGCIDAVGAQTYPLEDVQVVLVDGCSTDGTVAAAAAAAARYPFKSFDVVLNERKRTSTSLNAGLAVATGAYIVRLDARSRVQPDYVERVVATLAERPEVGEVGGAQLAVPRTRTAIDVGIARGQHNRWTSGWSTYRRRRGSCAADHVWMGAFRADDLRRLGGWDDATALNEDFELSERYRKAGFLVWFDASLRSGYLPRPSLRLLARQHFYFGRVKGMWWARGRRPLPRQVACLVLPPLAVGASAVAARRFGVARVVAALALCGVVLEAGGADEPRGGPAVHAASALSIAVYSLSWWAGVVAGVVGQLAGVEHRHG